MAIHTKESLLESVLSYKEAVELDKPRKEVDLLFKEVARLHRDYLQDTLVDSLMLLVPDAMLDTYLAANPENKGLCIDGCGSVTEADETWVSAVMQYVNAMHGALTNEDRYGVTSKLHVRLRHYRKREVTR